MRKNKQAGVHVHLLGGVLLLDTVMLHRMHAKYSSLVAIGVGLS